MQQSIEVNTAILNRFVTLINNGRLAHAYLFIGPAYVGKSEAALDIAKLINCEEKVGNDFFCGQCSSCLKIKTGNHPDIYLIESDFGETIKSVEDKLYSHDLVLDYNFAGKKVTDEN